MLISPLRNSSCFPFLNLTPIALLPSTRSKALPSNTFLPTTYIVRSSASTATLYLSSYVSPLPSRMLLPFLRTIRYASSPSTTWLLSVLRASFSSSTLILIFGGVTAVCISISMVSLILCAPNILLNKLQMK